MPTKTKQETVPPSMQVVMRPIADLTPDPGNVREHSPRNVEAIKASLQRFGQQKPIVVDENGVVRAGNGTLEAAKALGWKELAVVISDLDSVNLAAYAIADNRTAELAQWNLEGLATLMRELQVHGVEPDELGWSEAEIQPLLQAPWDPSKGTPEQLEQVEGTRSPIRILSFEIEQWDRLKALLGAEPTSFGVLEALEG